MHKPIYYGKQSISTQDIEAVTEVIKSDFLTQGPKVAEFEKALADYCGVKEAVVFNNGTTALHGMYAAYKECGSYKIKDQAILVPSLTFAATVNAALYAGFKPIFLDCDENGHVIIDEKLLTGKTSAIVTMDYAGNPVDINKIKEFALSHDLDIFDDACHGLGGSYQGKKIGSLGDMNVLSFHPVKSITTGEGGAILTDNPDWAKFMRQFRQHGITKNPDDFVNENDGPWYHEMHILGHNFRLTDMQCALGISQLKRINEFIAERKMIAKKYELAFNGNPYFDIPKVREGVESAWHLYAIRLKKNLWSKKVELFKKMAEKNIHLQVHYIPVYWHPYYAGLGYKRGLCPGAETFYQSEISLPIYPSLAKEDQDYVLNSLISTLEELNN